MLSDTYFGDGRGCLADRLTTSMVGEEQRLERRTETKFYADQFRLSCMFWPSLRESCAGAGQRGTMMRSSVESE